MFKAPMRRRSRYCAALLAGAALLARAAPEGAAAGQRAYTPADYQAQRVHQSVTMFAIGSGTGRAYVFMPAEPTPKGAPLVLFHHGWLGMNPLNFGGLIDLLARRGAVVIYPVYQDGDKTSPQAVTALAAGADHAALLALRARYPGLVDENKTLYLGYSMGAAISFNLALAPQDFALPAPRALLLMAPGDAHHVVRGPEARSIYGDPRRLPADLPTVLVAGLADTSIGLPTARQLDASLCHLRRHNLILLPSDADAGHSIAAGHGSPGAPDSRYNFPDPQAPVADGRAIAGRPEFEPSGSLNLLDYYGYWRLATRLADYANGQPLPEELFGAGEENRYLGRWPSGKPYASAQIENPCASK